MAVHIKPVKTAVHLFGLVKRENTAFVILSLFTHSLLGSDLPQDQYLKAYGIVLDGDKYYAIQDLPASDEKYIAAEQMLEKIKADFPDWEPSIIDYRLETIRAKMTTQSKNEKQTNKGKPDETLGNNPPDSKRILEIEVDSCIAMPFDRKEILNLIPVKAGQVMESGNTELWKKKILDTGKYKSVEIKESETQDARGGKCIKLFVVIEPDISHPEVEAYLEKSRRPENLKPKKTWWGKYCYCNQDGVGIIEAEFEEAYPFEGELACVKQNGRYGLINAKGEFVVSPIYSEKISFDSLTKTIITPKGVRLNTSRLPDKAEEVRKAVQQPRINERGEEIYHINLENGH